MNLTLDHLDPTPGSGDVETVHAWVVEDRARFWMMQEHTLDEVREIYQWLHDQPTHASYLVRAGDERLALFQTYDPRAEEVGEHFPVEDGDLGVHFMLAPADAERADQPERLGATASIMTFLLDQVFADPVVQRIVAEPDARNGKAIGLLTRLGFTLGEQVELSMKPAQLAYLTREAYASSAFSKKTSA